MRILIVEDEADIADFIRRGLTEAGFAVDVARDGAEGLEMETDPAKARALAREAVAMYMTLPNYCNSWRRLGYSEEDIATVSDRLIDGIFAWGSADQIAARVKAHHDAGADHVCIQVISGTGIDGARHAWRELAKVLL